jgi:hypothetical protein
MTTDRATFNRQKNDPKSQPHKMAHLVFPDIPIAIGTNAKKTKKPVPTFREAIFLPTL